MEKMLRRSFTDFLGELFIKDKLDEELRNTARYILEDSNPVSIKFSSAKSGNLLFAENYSNQIRIYKDREVSVKDGYVTDAELGYIKVPLHKYLDMLKRINHSEKIILNSIKFTTNSVYII